MNKGNAAFMIFIGFLGFILTYASWNIGNKLNKKACLSSDLKNSNHVVGVLGMTGIVSFISYFICVLRCGCDKTSSYQSSGLGIYGYLFFVFVIGITVIVLGSIIEKESKGECKQASKYTGMIWGTGVCLVIFSTSFFGFKAYEQYKSKGAMRLNSFNEMSSSF